MAFMSRQSVKSDSAFGGQSIYTVSTNTIARRRALDPDLTFILILSLLLAIGLTLFITWLCLYVLKGIYTKAKMEAAWQIAHEKFHHRVMEDPVIEVKLAEIAFKISRDLSFFTYLQLELHRTLKRNNLVSAEDQDSVNNVARKQLLSNEIAKNCLTKEGRRDLLRDVLDSLYMSREAIVCALIQLAPSLPSLSVTWLYQRVRQSEIYLEQPMDFVLDILAEWLMIIALLTISMDVLEFLFAKLAFYPKKAHPFFQKCNCIIRAVKTFHGALRSSCYLNSALITSNLCIWIILAIALKPERAIPAATAVFAMIAHVSNLYQRLVDFLAMFERIAEEKMEKINSSMRKLGVGQILDKCLPIINARNSDEGIVLTKLANTADRLKQKLTRLNSLEPLKKLLVGLQSNMNGRKSKDVSLTNLLKVVGEEAKNSDRRLQNSGNELALTLNEYLNDAAATANLATNGEKVKWSLKGARSMLSDIQTLKNYIHMYERDPETVKDMAVQNSNLSEDLMKSVIRSGLSKDSFEKYVAKQLGYEKRFRGLRIEMKDPTEKDKEDIEMKDPTEKDKEDTESRAFLVRIVSAANADTHNFNVVRIPFTKSHAQDTKGWSSSYQNAVKMCTILVERVDVKCDRLLNLLKRAINYSLCLENLEKTEISKLFRRATTALEYWESAAQVCISLQFLETQNLDGDSIRNSKLGEDTANHVEAIYSLVTTDSIEWAALSKILRQLCGMSGDDLSFQWSVVTEALFAFIVTERKDERDAATLNLDEVAEIVKQLSNRKERSPRLLNMIRQQEGKALEAGKKEISENIKGTEERFLMRQALAEKVPALHQLKRSQIEVVGRLRKKALTKIRRVCYHHFQRQKENLLPGETASSNISYVLRVFARSGILLDGPELQLLVGIFSQSNIVKHNLLRKISDGSNSLNLERVKSMMDEGNMLHQKLGFGQINGALNKIDQAVENFMIAAKFKDNLGRVKDVADRILQKYGLSRYKLAMLVFNSSILLLLLFILIFVSQNAFALPGLAAGIISSFLCTGTTGIVNRTVKKNATSDAQRDKILNDIHAAQNAEFAGDGDLLEQLNATTVEVIESGNSKRLTFKAAKPVIDKARTPSRPSGGLSGNSGISSNSNAQDPGSKAEPIDDVDVPGVKPGLIISGTDIIAQLQRQMNLKDEALRKANARIGVLETQIERAVGLYRSMV
jgi:hypothetical protein